MFASWSTGKEDRLPFRDFVYAFRSFKSLSSLDSFNRETLLAKQNATILPGTVTGWLLLLHIGNWTCLVSKILPPMEHFAARANYSLHYSLLKSPSVRSIILLNSLVE